MYKVSDLDIVRLKASLLAPRDRSSILQRDNFTCTYCGAHDESGDLLSVEQAVPADRGGINLAYNLRTICWLCKRQKGKKTDWAYSRRF